MLPFGTDQFFAVFGAYNDAIWPAQIVAYLLGASAVALVGGAAAIRSRLVVLTLAAGWLWTGIVYHGIFFAAINPAARIFAVGSVVQAGLFLWLGVVRWQLLFGWRSNAGTMIGVFLILYAAILYPALGYWMGHAYPAAPSFGLTPCPLTIFTFGLLLLTTRRVPKLILILPILWSLIGGSAAFLLQVPQDWMLLASGIVGGALIWVRDAKERQSPVAADNVLDLAPPVRGID